LTAQLIDGRSDRHEWSETYERDLDDVFTMQDEIAENVVREMKVRLFGAPPAATITDTGAYDTYLHGLSLLARRGQENLLLAEDLFEQVIDVDPEYAPAHASLALALVWQDPDSDDVDRRAEEAANRALALDPDNSDALTVLGFLAWDRDADLDAARSFFQRAIERNPNNATAYRWLARSYGEENPRRYYSLARKAYFVDPLDPTIHFHLGASSLQLGRFADALAAARQVAMDGDASYGHLQAMNIHQSSGRLDRAIKTAYHNYRVKPKSWSYAAIFWSLIKMGELDLAEAWLEEAKRQVGWSYVEPDDAFLAYLRGDPEKALAMQEAAVERGEINKMQLALSVIPFTQDFEYAKQLMDDQFAKFEHDPTTFAHDLPTPVYVSYALILQRVGEPEQAAALMREIEASVDAQIDNGIATTEFNGPRAIRAQLHAMRGDSTQAVEVLRKLFDDGYSEVDFLTITPYFDKIRDDPGFVSLIADMERRISDQRRQLIAEGMLLTPSEVAALETFDFDPFEL